MATSDRTLKGQDKRETPELVSSWALVTLVETIILVLMLPALFRLGTIWGIVSLLFVLFLVAAAYTLRRGMAIGYQMLTLFNAISLLALLVMAVAFVTISPIWVSILIAIALYLSGYVKNRGRRGTSVVLQALAAILALLVLITAPPEARSRIYVMLGGFAVYLFTGGAVRFYLGNSFDALDQPQVLRYFGHAEPPASRRLVSRISDVPSQWVQASYQRLASLFGGISVGTEGVSSAGRRLRSVAPQGNSQRALQVAAIILAVLIFPYLIRSLEGVVDISILISMNVGLLFVVLALGLNIVVGFAGLLDLGYAAFFAIGAYTVGVFTWPNLGLQWSFWIVILVSTLVAAIFGMIIGAPTLRLRGDYLAIVTLAFGEIVPRAIREMWDIKIKIPFTTIYLLSEKGLFYNSHGAFVEGFNLTNGPQGMNPVGRPMLFGHQLGVASIHLGPLEIPSQIQWYFLIAILGSIVLFASFRLERSRLGRAWMAIREDETAADAMGVNPVRTKLLAFALGASFSGFAGAIYAAMVQAIFPELFSFLVSIFLLIIVIVSGMGNIWGVLVGGLLISLFDRVILAQIVPEFVPGGDVLQRWRWVMYASGLIAIMIFRPEGLFPSAARRRELHEDMDLADADIGVVLEVEKEAVHEMEAPAMDGEV